MTVKTLATGLAGIAIIGAAAAGVSATAPVSPAAHQVQPVVFGVPLPLDPAAVPSAGELLNVLNGLQAPGSFMGKSSLIQGGINPLEARLADVQYAQAAAQGQFPLSFQVNNIQAAGPGVASADVTASGPKIAPVTRNVTFVNQGGSWAITRASAMSLLQEAGIGIPG